MATFQSIAVTFEKSIIKTINWVTVLALCLFELSIVLWFWPSTPTLISLFLTGIFYTIIGLSHAWFDRRLFRGVMWEYIWVGALVFFMLIFLHHGVDNLILFIIKLYKENYFLDIKE